MPPRLDRKKNLSLPLYFLNIWIMPSNITAMTDWWLLDNLIAWQPSGHWPGRCRPEEKNQPRTKLTIEGKKTTFLQLLCFFLKVFHDLCCLRWRKITPSPFIFCATLVGLKQQDYECSGSQQLPKKHRVTNWRKFLAGLYLEPEKIKKTFSGVRNTLNQLCHCEEALSPLQVQLGFLTSG